MKYLALNFKYGFLTGLKDLPSHAFKSFFFILFLFCYSTVWQKLGKGPEYTLYILFSEVIFFSLPGEFRTYFLKIKNREIQLLDFSPISFGLKEYFLQAGAGLARAIVLLFTGAIYFRFTHSLWLPNHFILMIPMAFVSILTLSSFQWILCWLSFWFRNTFAFIIVWQKIVLILGGVLIPLNLMPYWIQFIAKILPFYDMIYIPSAIAAGIIDQSYLTLKCVFWIFGGLLMNLSLYEYGFKKVAKE